MTKTTIKITKYEKIEKKAVLAVNAAFPPFINRLEWPIKKSCSYRNYLLSPYSDEKTFFTSLERKLKLYVQTNKIWKLFFAHTKYEDKTAFLNATDPLILAIKQNTPESLQLQSLRLLKDLYGIDRTHLYKLLEAGDRDKARLLHVSGDLVYDAFNTQDVDTHVSRVITALSTPKIQKYRPRAKPVKGEPIQLIARGSPAQLYMEILCVDEIELDSKTASVLAGNLGVRLYFSFCEARLLSNIDLIIKEVRAKQIRGH